MGFSSCFLNYIYCTDTYIILHSILGRSRAKRKKKVKSTLLFTQSVLIIKTFVQLSRSLSIIFVSFRLYNKEVVRYLHTKQVDKQ